MSGDYPDYFVECIMKGLCRKLSGQEGDSTSECDRCCKELLEFSHHFQEVFTANMYNLPAALITSETLLKEFLSMLCQRTCTREGTVDRKLAIFGSLVANLVVLSFRVPCYQLIKYTHELFVTYLKIYFFEFWEHVSFEDLRRNCLQLNSNTSWIVEKRQQLQNLIQEASNPESPVLPREPDFFTLITNKNVEKSLNCNEGLCPFCHSYCESYLQKYLRR